MSPNKNVYLPKKAYERKLGNERTREMGEGNKFFLSTSLFRFDELGDI